MAVYLFTFHAYRSWNADRPRGFVRHEKRILPPDPKIAEYYNRNASGQPMLFEPLHQQVLIWIVYDVCVRRSWRLHCMATDPTHIHILISWREFQQWEEVHDRLKNLASLFLGRKCNRPGVRWFSRKGSRKRVRDRRHFDYLVNKYLPSHRGLRWCDGDPPPVEPPPQT